jgi:hypothetical protein
VGVERAKRFPSNPINVSAPPTLGTQLAMWLTIGLVLAALVSRVLTVNP